MTLAVAVVISTSLALGDDGHDVTASDDASSEPMRAQLPDAVTLTCAPSGIDVPVASIRPQSDGLHLDVVNDFPAPTEVWIEAHDDDAPDHDWDSGRIAVASGKTRLVQAAPPGVLTVGCRIGDHDQKRQIELVDVEHKWTEPKVSCGDDDPVEVLPDLPVPPEPAGQSYVSATRKLLVPLTKWNDRIDVVGEPRGYPDQRYGTSLAQPMVQVLHSDQTVALVYLAGEDPDRPAAPPWTVAPRVEVCKSFLKETGSTTTR
jgi:hypothetical protein